MQLKFIYSEKATKFCEIFILLLSYVVPFNSKVEISQDSMAFSENMNFKRLLAPKCFFLIKQVCCVHCSTKLKSGPIDMMKRNRIGNLYKYL